MQKKSKKNQYIFQTDPDRPLSVKCIKRNSQILKPRVFEELKLFKYNFMGSYITLKSPATGNIYKFVINIIRYLGSDLINISQEDLIFRLHLHGYAPFELPANDLIKLIDIRDSNFNNNISVETNLVDDMEKKKLKNNTTE
jgi:hypothetical protein